MQTGDGAGIGPSIRQHSSSVVQQLSPQHSRPKSHPWLGEHCAGWQLPLQKGVLPLHWTPHPPQLNGSLSGLTHVPLQQRRLRPHAGLHAPPPLDVLLPEPLLLEPLPLPLPELLLRPSAEASESPGSVEVAPPQAKPSSVAAAATTRTRMLMVDLRTFF
jgi:hypothetical protein